MSTTWAADCTIVAVAGAEADSTTGGGAAAAVCTAVSTDGRAAATCATAGRAAADFAASTDGTAEWAAAGPAVPTTEAAARTATPATTVDTVAILQAALLLPLMPPLRWPLLPLTPLLVAGLPPPLMAVHTTP